MARKPTLVWVPKGLDPLSSFFEFGPANAAGVSLSIFNRISEAVTTALEEKERRDADDLLPYICIGTGEGTAVFNLQGILALEMALAERPEGAHHT